MNAQHEPTALSRQVAHVLHDNFAALTQAGFAEAQALQIVATMLTIAWHKPNQ